DSKTFDTVRTVAVRDAGGNPVDLLNELECLGSWALANRWQSNEIVAIDLGTGSVVGTLDLTELVPPDLERSGAVLNGIAYRSSTDTYFVTGKLWPVMYELELRSG
ncbi:MAG: glutaminyl-peptide cyclotransferase, partial [Acidimicrobiales bacterium]|nr:glutaminyl-peptide cyclotransferase [Acidimicrobiales bacterium]